MKILHNVMRTLFALVLVTPILGALGVFPSPTADLYTPAGWAFMSALMATGYMMPLLGILCAAGLILVVLNKTALAAIVMLPMTVNVVLFHAVVDTGLFTVNASLGWVLLICNAYFLYENTEKYKKLW
ncbi:MAG: hypothetical protein KBC47_01540 [Candidatus Peribacteraceae bacterium]|nr:hypothetical protein [Candidatus Peribacteraceae bacterium]